MNQTLELLCCRVGERVVALDIMGIREILRAHAVTPVPNAPDAVAGVLNLRGELLPVVDLRRALLHDPSAADAEEAKLVVARARGCSAGLQVDQVLEVVSVEATELQPVPGGGPGGGGVVAAFRRDLDGQGAAVVLVLRLAALFAEIGIDAAGGGG